MALIICPECGKQISDKAAACINCGCPVSAMKTKVAAGEKNAAAAAPVGEIFQEFFDAKAAKRTSNAAPVKTVPDEIPEIKMLPGIVVQVLEKFCGMAGLAGIVSLAAVVMDLLRGDHVAGESIGIAAAGILGSFILSYFSILMKFRHVKKYLRKNGYEASIRNDSPALTNAIKAYNLYPSGMMVAYIKKCNPVAGETLGKVLAQSKAKKRKERLGNLPYLVVLLAVYYLLPRYEETLHLPYESSLIVCHVLTLLVMGIYGYKNSTNYKLCIALAVFVAPAVLAYFYTDMWYHILICFAAALVSMWIGKKVHARK